MLVFAFLVVAISSLGIAPGVLAAKPNVVGYYSSLAQQVDFSKYTHINLAFAIPAQDGTISFDQTVSLPTIVGQIQAKNAKAIVSIGGWSGSKYFSTFVKDTSASNPFITSIVNFVDSNKLDGIDIDWEYPGRAGNDGNVIDKVNDTPNYLKFVTNLRAAFTSKFGTGKKLITMAVYIQPFYINDSPSKDVSAFAKVVDYINLMQYDINGAWMTTTGPNAPLYYQDDKATQSSFVTAIDAWTGAGWPANQVNVGLAFYGRATIAKEDMSKDPNNQYQAQKEGVLPNCGGNTEGIWQWDSMRTMGVLSSPSTATAPWVRYWDDFTQTPWLFNPSNMQFVSYDDPQSITAKINYAKGKGLAGAMVWSMEMDYNAELLDTIVDAWSGATTLSVSTSSTTTTDAVASIVSDSNSDSGSGSTTAGSSCPTNYVYKCGAAGTSVTYFVCINKSWVQMSCGAGTVCAQNDNTISCGMEST